jgi:hypothetical protein
VVFVLLGTAAFSGLGLLMAGTLRAEATLAVANGLYLVFLLLGGFILPLDRLPGPVGLAAHVLPAAALTDATRAALAEGNREYEERFDRVFLVRAAGRSPEELLAELRRRLGNDEEIERAEVTGQLAEITALRVRGLVT